MLYIRGRERFNWVHGPVYRRGGQPVEPGVYVCILLLLVGFIAYDSAERSGDSRRSPRVCSFRPFV